MRRRIYVFCVLAVIAAAVFVRLGFWQLARLGERRAYNRTFTSQQILTPVSFEQLPPNADSARYRGAVLSGVYDYEHEVLLSPRTRRGSPGVDIITPLRRPGNDTVVLVNRGWVYSPDLSSIDQKRWRETDTATVRGYVDRLASDSVTTRSSNPRLVRRLSRSEVALKVPYPVSGLYMIAVGDTTDLAHPARRDLPALDEGNHMNYAIQWFTFAAIALVGAGIVVARERRVL